MQPDLSISQFLFTPTNDKTLRVRVVNTGQATLRCVPAGSNSEEDQRRRCWQNNLCERARPGGRRGGSLLIDAKSILPNNVSLQSTTFRLNVDATEIVAESNESNNEVWHNQ